VKIAITGSSGLIGTALTRHLRSQGHEVLRMVRRAPQAADEVRWNPRAAADGGGGAGELASSLRDIDAAVHLAGAPIASGRWTAARKREILTSRTEGTATLARLLASLRPRPVVLLSGSGTGWYGDTGNGAVDESGAPGSGFLANVAQAWEASTVPAEEAGIRVVRMRTGLVLSKDGGIVGRLLPLFRLGLGARLGPGTQFMSWIMLTDLVRAVDFLLANAGIAGPVNLASPNPVTNAVFTAAFAGALRRPALLRVPSRVLDLALGEAAAEILMSARVLPTRLLDAGYEFVHADIAGGLASELRPR
jgi:uncharacterized protein